MPYKLIDVVRTFDVGTQRDLITTGDGKWISDNAAEKDIDSDDSDDDCEIDIELTDSEVKAIVKQKSIADEDGSWSATLTT